ncbi:hypothetical protein F5Y16DRAFT_389265 [Xylariaceae sp. FL0255]|nr:hypothetical protein F5Y16DRAFT_389265 [Xylariaceae sp. FL0255]
MQPNPISIQKARKRDITQFAKRRKTHIKKTHDLSQNCNTQIYTPPRMTDIVSQIANNY